MAKTVPVTLPVNILDEDLLNAPGRQLLFQPISPPAQGHRSRSVALELNADTQPIDAVENCMHRVA